MRRIVSIILLLLAMSATANAQPQELKSDDIVILYDNDVHGAVEGYARMAALKQQVLQKTQHVLVVSAGDFLSGSSYGSLSRGEYLIRLMNAVGYDYVTLGNHEFDFGIPNLKKQSGKLSAKTVCCNFSSIEGQDPYPSYSICQIGGKRLAFVGVTTPTVPTSSTPSFFTDSTGRWLYTFHGEHLDSILQARVNAARNEGADYVIVLSHLGETNLPPVVKSVTGIDVVIDGHTHSVIADSTLFDKGRNKVLWTQTGAYFEHVGELVIHSDGTMKSSLVSKTDIPSVSNSTSDTLQVIQSEYEAIGNRWVAHSAVTLGRKDYQKGAADCTLGNFFADAFRVVGGAQIGLMNTGGMRVDIPAGEVTFHHLFSAAPFDNRLIVVEVSGQTILDALEMGCRKFPKGSGSFLQVSGMTYEIDTTARKNSKGGYSSVQLDPNGIFVGVSGERKVRNVMVWNAERGEYEPLDPARKYSVAGCDYTLLNHGDGHNFPDARVIKDDGIPYVEALEIYIREHLRNLIGPYYAWPKTRIKLVGTTK